MVLKELVHLGEAGYATNGDYRHLRNDHFKAEQCRAGPLKRLQLRPLEIKLQQIGDKVWPCQENRSGQRALICTLLFAYFFYEQAGAFSGKSRRIIKLYTLDADAGVEPGIQTANP